METTALLSRNASELMDQRRWRVPHPPTGTEPSSPPRAEPRQPRVGSVDIAGGDGTTGAAVATARAAVAARGSSRQFFYGNAGLWSSAASYQPNPFGSPSHVLAASALHAAPSDSLSNSASGRNSLPASRSQQVLRSVPVTATSSDSTAADDAAAGGPLHPLPERVRLPSPRQLHEDYSHRLHRNQVAGGRRNFVVGGAMGRYRDYEGELVEVPEEVRAVRTAALTVLRPLTYCWLILTVGISVSIALGTARWTQKIDAENCPYWIIFLPAWLSHLGLLIMHAASGTALSKFIAEANDNRRREDSTDHLDRVEYLPLLQKSLKIGLRTAVLCFTLFVFEILLFIRLEYPSRISLGVTYAPLWIVTTSFILNGILCKSQSVLYSAVWFLIFMSMLMSVLRLDLNVYSVQPYIVIAVMALLGVVSGTLIYIVHGHQVGYYKLTDAQLTAGVFYATSSFLAVLVVSIMADALSLPDLIQVDLLIVIVLLSPVVVILGGLGAYFVSRDEYDRLLEHGGQNAVVPMDLVLEQDGWTSVLGRGTVQIPLFGDVEYAPLGPEAAEAAGPCCCYPTVRAEEGRAGHGRLPGARNYQSPAPPGSRMEARATWGGSEAPIV